MLYLYTDDKTVSKVDKKTASNVDKKTASKVVKDSKGCLGLDGKYYNESNQTYLQLLMVWGLHYYLIEWYSHCLFVVV